MPKADRRPVALDTSAIIALVAGWHEEHDATRGAVEALLAKGHELVVPSPAIVEAYSVLTRLPPPHRLSPAVAQQLLRANFESAKTVALKSAAVWIALDEAAKRGISGGRVHDWIIARASREAGPCILVTLNARHFEPFDADELWVRTPGEPA